MRRDELPNLQCLSKLLLDKVKAKRIDILVEVKEETPLQPTAHIKGHIPYQVGGYAIFQGHCLLTIVTSVFRTSSCSPGHLIETPALRHSS